MAASKKAASSGGTETTGAVVNPEDAQATGWLGVRNNLHADEEFALTSGPDSPGAVEAEDAEGGGSSTPEAPAGD